MQYPDHFLGTWQLIPELSLHATGNPPSAGLCEIQQAERADELLVRVSWRMAGETAEHSTQISGRADGVRIALPETPGARGAFAISRIDERTLESTVLRGDEVIAFARRVVSSDGDLMSVLQESRAGPGQPVRNFQVYRRVAAPASPPLSGPRRS